MKRPLAITVFLILFFSIAKATQPLKWRENSLVLYC